MAKHVIRRTPKKSSQSNAYVERAHQSVEAMVRTMKEVIDRRTNQFERHGKHHELDDSTRSILANTFLCWKRRQNTIQKTTSQRLHDLCHLDQVLLRKSETNTLNAANSIPDSFQAFGLEEPQRATSTLLEQHKVYTQQGRVERRMFRKSGTVVSSRL